MSTASIRPIIGQDTLIASWRALAAQSPGARVARTRATVAAVFPTWAPLNNAILLAEPSSVTAAAAAIELTDLYGSSGVDSWALWLPSSADRLDAPDEITVVGGLRRLGDGARRARGRRRHGVARALLRGVLGDAHRRGARTATLQSTAMGEPLYRSLGFRPVGRYDEWVPA